VTCDVRKMKTRLTLRPGQRGTRRLVTEYGDRLVCVRYRYDAEQQKRVKTVEIILEEIEWKPAPKKSRWAGHVVVGLRIDVRERELQRAVKAAGGKWNSSQKIWELTYGETARLGLEDRICEKDERHP
jgi:hypothetical protein